MQRVIVTVSMATLNPLAVGTLLRDWRQRRHLSQLALACEAEISSRHLSFMETGRAAPSREMILHLAEQLKVPLRERNVLLVAGGYAPMFRERSLDAPELDAARQAIDLVLRGHEPYPALAIDRHWNLIMSNRVVPLLLEGVDASLLQPPTNVLRLTLHPAGLASRIENFQEWRGHLLDRLSRQIELSADATLIDLMKELRSYPQVTAAAGSDRGKRDYAGVVVSLELSLNGTVLEFFSTTTVFGTPVDITLSELALESFFPANSPTAEVLRRMFKSQS